MPDLDDGEEEIVQGSGHNTYTLKRDGDVYSCTCPAWQYQGAGIDLRTCKHLRKFRGDAEETARVGTASPAARARSSSGGSTSSSSSTAIAPPLLLAHKWEAEHDPAGWLMSEKLDGVRAFWDGTQLISRLGNAFSAPDWFVDELPENTPLDGELFMERGEFQKTVSVVRSGGKGDGWKQIKYLVFDAPKMSEKFEKRLEVIAETLEGLTYAEALLHEVCDDIDHLKKELERIEALGGEGLMLRKPGSTYVAGRSATLLKVKTFYDAEARVRAHVPGKGKHKGRMGALECEIKDGTVFNVGTGFTDKQREDPPKVGDIITFRYQELTKAGVPRFPSFVGERADVTWDSMSPLPTSGGRKSTGKPAASAPAAARPAASKPVIATAAPVSTASGPLNNFRRYEFDDGNSRKFWEVATREADVLIRFGRLGTNGQVQIKSMANPTGAESHADKQAQSKVSKGYSLVQGAQPPQEFMAQAPAIAAATTVTQTQHQRGAGDDLRRLEFDDGSSQKFWENERWGNELVIRFGKLGTEGQVRVKTYDTSAACRADAVKQADAKIAKGYVEVQAAGVVPAGMPAPAVPAPQPSKPAAAAPKAAAPIVSTTNHQRGAGHGLRRLEFDDRKFWEIERFGSELVIRWGKLGTDGQLRVKAYDDADEADDEAADQADSKIGKGYVEVTQAAAPASSGGTAVPDRSSAIVSTTDHARGDGEGLRRLEMDDEKFWEIERFDHELVIRWGVLGEESHVRVKRYADADAAEEEAERQADTKLSRGYDEVDADKVDPMWGDDDDDDSDDDWDDDDD